MSLEALESPAALPSLEVVLSPEVMLVSQKHVEETESEAEEVSENQDVPFVREATI